MSKWDFNLSIWSRFVLEDGTPLTPVEVEEVKFQDGGMIKITMREDNGRDE